MQQLELENRRLTERAEEKEKTASEARADCDEARGALFQVEFLVFYFGDLLSYVEEIGNKGGQAFEVFWTTKDITQEPDVLK